MKTIRHPYRKTLLAMAATLVVGTVPTQRALGATSCTWDPTTGNWSDASGWSCGVIPTGPDQDGATIALGKTVTVDSAQSIYTLGNAGTIAITASSLTLQGGGSTINSGAIHIGTGASFASLVAGNDITNTGGTITVANGSALDQTQGIITGGTITTTGTGALMVFSNGANVLSGVSFNGVLDASTQANARERIAGGMTLNGTVNIGNGGVVSLDSTFGADQTIAGNGSFALQDAGARLAFEGNGTTTFGSGIVVHGQGEVGTALFSGGANTLVNQGRISADVGGTTLTINQPGNSGSLTNTGTLDARNGAQLVLATAVANAGGTISALDGSSVLQNGYTITAGTVSTSGTGAFEATSNGNNVLDGVTVSGLVDLHTVANAREIIVNGATIDGSVHIANGGILSLDSAGTTGGAQAIAGTATIDLDDAAARLAIEGDGSTTLGAGITVRGQGNIGRALFIGGTNVLTNNGTISADVSGGTLEITAPGNSGSLVNNATLQATGGGTLLLSTNITANAGSQIIANTGSTVEQNGVTINGVFKSSGGGLFTASSNGNNILDDVSFTGALDASSITNARERIGNGFALTGSVNIGHGGVVSLDSTLAADNGISGTASFNLNDSGAWLAVEGAGTTTLGTNVTVHGQGLFGQALFAGGANALTNDGLVSADVNGGTLTLVAPANSGSFTNNGTLQATGGGNLRLQTSILADSGSQITAANASTVTQAGVTLNGKISTFGSGSVVATSDGNNVLTDTAFTGTLDATSIANARERIGNGMVLNGAVNIAGGGVVSLDSTLDTTAGATNAITGSGTFNLNDATAHLAVEGAGSTTLGANIVVRGQGSFGTALFSGGVNALTNDGRISADVAGGTLTIQAPANSGTFTNAGLMDARGGGTLTLSTDILNGAGTIAAQAGSTLVQNGVRITGGSVTTTGTGSLEVQSNTNDLDATSFSGTLDLTTIQNARERIVNGATLNGNVNIANGGILSLDTAETASGAQTIAGTVSINLNDASAYVSVEGDGSTTLGSGVTIHGQGLFGRALFQGGVDALTNLGVFSADVNGGTLEIQTPGNSGTFVNDNLLEARNGATLLLSTSVSNASGQIDALAGSLVKQNGVTISGGTIGTTGSGRFVATSDGNNILDGVTLNGAADLSTITNARDRLVGGATINGTVTIGNGGILSLDDTVTTGAAQTIGGTGTLRLADAGARLSIEGAGTTTLGAGLTVSGQGNIGTALFQGGVNTLFNNGVILADGGTLTITAPANSGTLAGTGTLQANGGTLVLSTGAQATQGKLVIGAAGSAATLNDTLVVTNDYTNAQSGSGNTFDRRAAITGTGQILAGGDATQVVTGANITGGTTTNATLTIGNVRVGTNTFDYQVANAGTSGPTLRGAIQTSVNGANLTDARLGGVGVTPGLYDAGAPGSSSGDLGVTFTAASTGALGALNNQSINLRSNFDNIADQKLNIVVASNAGAYAIAQGAIQTPALNFGTVQVGQSVSQGLVVRNTATGANGYVEDLDAAFGSATGTGAAAIGGSGSFAGIVAGTDSTASNGAMTVAVNTARAGTVNGGITVDYTTNGTVRGVSNGLGTAAAGSESYGVIGTVVNRAAPRLSTTTVDFGAHRVGDTVAAIGLGVTNQNVGSPQAALDASITGGGAPVVASGSVSLLAPGAAGSLNVGFSTAAAGNFTGANAAGATIGFVSDASNIGGCGTHCQLTLDSQAIAVTGKVYTPAVAVVNTPVVDFGIVHTGDTIAAKGVSVTNGAAVTALNDTLRGSIGGATGAFSATGTLAGVAAQATDSASLKVAFDTGTSGVYTGSAIAAFQSHDADLADAGLGSTSVQLKGTVDNYAFGTLAKSGGAGSLTASDGGSLFTLDLGTFTQGSGNHTDVFAVGNGASGLADLLSGSFAAAPADGAFQFSGFTAFSGLGAGQSQDGYTVTLASASAGSFDETLVLHAVGSNASGYSAGVGDITLRIEGTVTGGGVSAVPEPSAWALMLAGFGALLGAQRRRRAPARDAA